MSHAPFRPDGTYITKLVSESERRSALETIRGGCTCSCGEAKSQARLNSNRRIPVEAVRQLALTAKYNNASSSKRYHWSEFKPQLAFSVVCLDVTRHLFRLRVGVVAETNHTDP
jgi:hypothetical protein